MGSPNAYDTPTAYDVLVLAGKASPGVVKLSNVGRETGWDEQAAQGQDGANTVKKGSKLVKFTATWTLTKDELRDDYAAWDTWSKILDTPVAAKSPKAIDAYHPQLAELGVRSVVVSKRGSKEPQSGQMSGSSTVVIEFLEYHPPKPAPATKPGGSKSETAPDPNADVKGDAAIRIQVLKELNDGHLSPASEAFLANHGLF